MQLTIFGSIILLLCLSTTCSVVVDPTPPQMWPGTWYTWVVTSIVKPGVSKPLYDFGQLIAYDTVKQYTCRTNQQDLLNPSPKRPVDMCDYAGGFHFMLDDTSNTTNCTGMVSVQGPLGQIVYPPQFLAAAKFLGVDKVAQKDCNHFLAMGITIGSQTIQMDVWTATDNNYPCEISLTDLTTKIVTTWAFDGFNPVIPPEAINQCSAPKILCQESDWVCKAKAGVTNDQLQAAIQWVCDPAHLDCSPIQPGGPHYLPNTLIDHCNWAFNAYFLKNRSTQGLGACDFGGIAHFVPPNSTLATTPIRPTVLFTDVFSNDLVCERN